MSNVEKSEVIHVARETSDETSHLVAALAEGRPCLKCTYPMRHNGQRWICRKCANAYHRQWRKTHPMTDEQRKKDAARSYANVYKSRGKLVPEPCGRCGAPNAQMHHEDYSKPVDVEWLCHACHVKEHYPDAESKRLRIPRRLVRHGGTLCSRCLAAPPARPGGGYCAPCHADKERERRQSLQRRSGEG